MSTTDQQCYKNGFATEKVKEPKKFRATSALVINAFPYSPMLITSADFKTPSALTLGQISEVKAIHPLAFTENILSTGHKTEVVFLTNAFI